MRCKGRILLVRMGDGTERERVDGRWVCKRGCSSLVSSGERARLIKFADELEADPCTLQWRREWTSRVRGMPKPNSISITCENGTFQLNEHASGHEQHERTQDIVREVFKQLTMGEN